MRRGPYRLDPWALDFKAGTSGPDLVTDLYVGGRSTYLSVDLQVDTDLPGPWPTLRRSTDRTEDWVDPMVRVRTSLHLTPNWILSAIGGFGVGADFTWVAMGLVGYRFNLWGENNASVQGGYRALSQDYKKGSGDDQFEWDITFHGPLLGFGFRFQQDVLTVVPSAPGGTTTRTMKGQTYLVDNGTYYRKVRSGSQVAFQVVADPGGS